MEFRIRGLLKVWNWAARFRGWRPCVGPLGQPPSSLHDAAQVAGDMGGSVPAQRERGCVGRAAELAVYKVVEVDEAGVGIPREETFQFVRGTGQYAQVTGGGRTGEASSSPRPRPSLFTASE